jgi:hypothetical protein
MRCLDLLLDAGADPTTPFSGTNPEDDYSPLHGALAVAVLNAPISYDKRVKFMFERIIHGSFMALDTATSGPSIWLTAFQWCSPSPELVQSLLDAGCDINETTIDFRNAPDGRNCLFLQVLRAKETGTSLEFATPLSYQATYQRICKGRQWSDCIRLCQQGWWTSFAIQAGSLVLCFAARRN